MPEKEKAHEEEAVEAQAETTEDDDDYSDEWARLTAATDDSDDDEEVIDDEDDEEPEGVVRAGSEEPATVESVEEKAARLERELAEKNHKLESEIGRSTGLQRKLSELRSQTTEQPTRQEISEAMKSPEAWDQFKEDYPEMSTSIEALVASEGNKIRESIKKDFQALIQPLTTAEADRRRMQEMDKLSAAHPDWKAVAGSSEFNTWVGDQPESVQAMLKSENAADAAFLLTSFKTATGTPSPANQTSGKTTEAANLRNKRANQKVTGAAVQTRTAAAPRGGDLKQTDDDFSTAFAREARKKEKLLREQGRL